MNDVFESAVHRPDKRRLLEGIDRYFFTGTQADIIWNCDQLKQSSKFVLCQIWRPHCFWVLHNCCECKNVDNSEFSVFCSSLSDVMYNVWCFFLYHSPVQSLHFCLVQVHRGCWGRFLSVLPSVSHWVPDDYLKILAQKQTSFLVWEARRVDYRVRLEMLNSVLFPVRSR